VIIRVQPHLPPADQLAGVVYEICNSRAYLRFGELMKRAASRTITRDAFVDGLLEAEMAGTRRAGDVLPRIMPLSPAERKPLQIYNACLDAPADFTQWQAWYRRHSRGGEYDVRASYGKLYDRIVTEGKTAIPMAARRCHRCSLPAMARIETPSESCNPLRSPIAMIPLPISGWNRI
jgi:hypothetical protein